MCPQDENNESFEETVRSIAREVSNSVQRAMSQVDVDEFAGTLGVDPDQAREWVGFAGEWLRTRAEGLGDEVAARAAGAAGGASQSARSGQSATTSSDSLGHAGPHPLDLPTEEQGLALAALDSGRWSVEPGTNALSSHGEGRAPSDALGLVRELRARDWIATDGELTLAGRHALSRWLDAADAH